MNIQPRVRFLVCAAALMIAPGAPATEIDQLNEEVVVDTASVSWQGAESVPAPEPTVESTEVLAAEPIHLIHPPIHYRVKGHHRTCGPTDPPVKVTLLVKDPCSCDCYVEIPVCIPCCCQGEAKVCDRQGILGRRWVDHEWACGFRISVLFRTRGDVVVFSQL